MIRFVADADLNEGIVVGCLRREPEMDFLSANDADSRQRRIAFWCRTISMPQHFGTFLQAGNSSPGVLLVPQRLSVGEAIEELVLIWTASDAHDSTT